MARNENNSPLLGELLEVYLRIPVTVALLKQNSAAKTIKKMQGKTEDDSEWGRSFTDEILIFEMSL